MRGDLTGSPARIPHAFVEVPKSPLSRGGWQCELRPHDGSAIRTPVGADLSEAQANAGAYVKQHFPNRHL